MNDQNNRKSKAFHINNQLLDKQKNNVHLPLINYILMFKKKKKKNNYFIKKEDIRKITSS